ADDTIETYDANGRLLSVVKHGGTPVTVQYASTGINAALPQSASDAFGHTLQFTYGIDSGGATRLTGVLDPSGNSISYTYSSGKLTKVTFADGTNRSYGYGSGYGTSLTSLTDESSVVFQTWGCIGASQIQSYQ